MTTLVFFLEEPSAKEMLQGLLPKILPDEVAVLYRVFQGKQDLEKNLVKRLRGWNSPDCHFVIMRDQDSGNCITIKEKLVSMCEEAGKKEALIRIACRELESFYLGDLKAVETGLKIKGIARHQATKKFRDPDDVQHPAEELVQLTSNVYQKISGSRLIGPQLSTENNKSLSFNALIKGIQQLVHSSKPNCPA